MQTKNINHDYRHPNELQANEHHVSCASFRLRAQPQAAPLTSGRTTTQLNSSSCHNRSKTSVLASNACDGDSFETGQVPTSEPNLARQYSVPVTLEASGNAALISSDSTRLNDIDERDQVPHFCTFSPDSEPGHFENCVQIQQQQVSNQSTSMHHHRSCFSGPQPSLSTLSAFVTNSSYHLHRQHQPTSSSSGHQHKSYHSPVQPMLLCGANSKTPPHQVAHSPQRCFANEQSEASLSAAATLPSHKQRHSTFGHSSTLPPNSTLSSLLASAKGTDQRTMHQPELRRQISLNQLDKVAESKSSMLLGKGEAKLGSFQQRLRAMLSPTRDSSKVSAKANAKTAANNTSTYRAGDEINFDSEQVNSVSVSKDCLARGRPLSTLNKYTVSVSNTNLTQSNQQQQPQAATIFTTDSYDEEESYHLRNVCNKLFSQKQYSCLHSASSNQQFLPENVMYSMQKSSQFGDSNSCRNITSEMNIDKISPKENIYSTYRSPNATATSIQPVLSVSASDSGPNHSSDTVEIHQSYSAFNGNRGSNTHEHDEHVVVVSDLQPKTSSPSNGLTVRSQTPSGQLLSSKIAETNNEGGSSLSLNVAGASESVASQEHNYKSSSESGRGTMNSHLEERPSHHIDLNSPADLTSLDSDQSNQDTNWKETNGSNCIRRSDTAVNMNSFSKIQRYLDEQRSSDKKASKDSDLTMCKEFKSKLSLHDESDSWTSLSDEPSNKKSSSKSKGKQPTSKHRHQVESKLTTNFSKPENCLSSNSKQPTLTPRPLSPGMKPKLIAAAPKMSENMEAKPPNGMLYDKCIYSVPNKGKFRNLAPYTNGLGPCDSKLCESVFPKSCDNASLSSDPESNFPDDGCSEFTDYNHQGPLRKQLRGIEDMYSELLSMLNSKQDHRPKRTKLYRRNSGRSSVASRNTRDYISRRYRNDHRRSKGDESQISRRYKKLESQVLTLAKSVSQLSADIQFNYMLNEEMESLRHEIEMIKSQMSNLRQNVSTLFKPSPPHQQQQQSQATVQQCATLNRTNKEPRKVDKLKRLFVDEPQPMKQFLKKLGYEKYSKHFETEKIGLAELMHLNEDRLLKLGIPMGPRIRILQEAKNLGAVINGKTSQTMTTTTGKQHAVLPDSYNIYAVV